MTLFMLSTSCAYLAANLCHNTYFGIDYIGLCIGLETGLVNHEAARYHCRQRGGMLYQTHSAVLSGILDSLLPKMFESECVAVDSSQTTYECQFFKIIFIECFFYYYQLMHQWFMSNSQGISKGFEG